MHVNRATFTHFPSKILLLKFVRQSFSLKMPLKNIPGLLWLSTGGYKVKLRCTDWHSDDRQCLLQLTLMLCSFCCHTSRQAQQIHRHTFIYKPLVSKRCFNWNFHVIQFWDPVNLLIIHLSSMILHQWIPINSVQLNLYHSHTWPFRLLVQIEFCSDCFTTLAARFRRSLGP